MKNKNRLMIALVIALLVSLMSFSAAFAHNAGHIMIDGQCINVGSLKEAPTVGDGNPNQLSNGQLDLIPGSGDQYGARFAADQGASAVLPGECP